MRTGMTLFVGAALPFTAGAQPLASGGAAVEAAGVEVAPLRVARARMTERGPERIGEWIAYEAPSTRDYGEMIFDCFVRDGPCASDFYNSPRGAGPRGFATDDFDLPDYVDTAAGVHRVHFAWYWNCNGHVGRIELCVAGLFTQDSDPELCEPDSSDYEGWFFDFGQLECLAYPRYYAADLDMGTFGAWPLPTDGIGSYMFGFIDENGDVSTMGEQCLWGTGDARGSPDAPGTQKAARFEDDNPVDGEHDQGECYNFDDVGCVQPEGGAMALWGIRLDPCGSSDCDGNAVIDTRDVLCFITLWTSQDNTADCDGNNAIDTRDVTCFLAEWAACR